jgi:hypothetical protein
MLGWQVCGGNIPMRAAPAVEDALWEVRRTLLTTRPALNQREALKVSRGGPPARGSRPGGWQGARPRYSASAHFIGSLNGFGERTGLSRTNLNVLPREHRGVTWLFDSFFSENLNRRHDVREVHRRYCRTRNRRAEITLRLPDQIYAVRDAAMVEQHVEQDDAGGRLMQGSDGRNPQDIARRQLADRICRVARSCGSRTRPAEGQWRQRRAERKQREKDYLRLLWKQPASHASEFVEGIVILRERWPA